MSARFISTKDCEEIVDPMSGRSLSHLWDRSNCCLNVWPQQFKAGAMQVFHLVGTVAQVVLKNFQATIADLDDN
jgi:hypothetical protein